MSESEIDLESYLTKAEVSSPLDMEKTTGATVVSDVTGAEGVISAKAVTDIIGNLGKHMEDLNQKLNQIRVTTPTAPTPTLDEVIITIPKDESINTLTTTYIPELSVRPKMTVLSPFTSSRTPVVSLSDNFTKLTHDTNIKTVTTSTLSPCLYTQPPTTALNVGYGQPYQPPQPIYPSHQYPPATCQTTYQPTYTIPQQTIYQPYVPLSLNSFVPMGPSMITPQYQLDSIQQQLSLLTQTVSLLTVLVNNSQKPKALEPKVFSYEKEHELHKFLEFKKYCTNKYP
ncbi:UNVERIFIED_CONTAM: hypothetical protein RMT77_014543 [Armadillidium vulgare]